MKTFYEAALAECRRGREIDHFLTFMMGIDGEGDAVRRGHAWFQPNGEIWEIVEIYRDGMFAAVRSPGTIWSGGEVRIFEARHLLRPCATSCGLDECDGTGSNCKRGVPR